MSHVQKTAGPPEPATEGSQKPLVWVLHGYRAGDTSQVLTLAEALGWGYEDKSLSFIPVISKFPNLLLGKTRKVLIRGTSSPLEPPWPDVAIGIGCRPVPVMRWIKAQSGGKTKLVQVGRPRLPRRIFDFILTSPQYRTPPLPNVLEIALPLHYVDEAKLEQGRKDWAEAFAHLPRPHIGFLVGGNAAPYYFDTRAAKQLARKASEHTRQQGGSLLVTTSNRTASSSTNALFEDLTPPAYKYRWKANDPANPYFGILADSDQLIVTGESVSMLTEACATGRPVYIYAPPAQRKLTNRIKDALYGSPLTRRMTEHLVDLGMSLPRDFDRLHRSLIAEGMAAWLGDPAPQGGRSTAESLAEAVARVKSLFLREQ